ncbi:hypothetical protein [Halococcus sp. IIIV-5B]|nr:hypothetical protein [Halococcus sp. IIIV-5B]
MKTISAAASGGAAAGRLRPAVAGSRVVAVLFLVDEGRARTE